MPPITSHTIPQKCCDCFSHDNQLLPLCHIRFISYHTMKLLGYYFFRNTLHHLSSLRLPHQHTWSSCKICLSAFKDGKLFGFSSSNVNHEFL